MICSQRKLWTKLLVDAGVVEKIARDAMVSDHCVAIEIGPGIGALTQYLCEYAKKSFLLKLMSDYHPFLRIL